MLWGPGPHYQLCRPYHLCSAETPTAIAEAVLCGETMVAPKTVFSKPALRVPMARRLLCTGGMVMT